MKMLDPDSTASVDIAELRALEDTTGDDQNVAMSLFELHQIIGGMSRRQRRVFLSNLRRERKKKKSGVSRP